MSTTETGRRAETVAANYLVRDGYEIIERNWRTRWCEIDIVATKRGILYFVEVKYRRSGAQGNGLDYITSKKLAQMHFAAEFWLTKHASSADYRLSALEVTGDAFAVSAWCDDI